MYPLLENTLKSICPFVLSTHLHSNNTAKQSTKRKSGSTRPWMTYITCNLLDGYSCFLKFRVVNADHIALNPQPRKQKVILLVGTMYPEVMVYSLWPHQQALHWQHLHGLGLLVIKCKHLWKKPSGFSPVLCSGRDDGGWLISYRNFKEKGATGKIGHKQQFLIAVWLRGQFRHHLTKTGCVASNNGGSRDRSREQ